MMITMQTGRIPYFFIFHQSQILVDNNFGISIRAILNNADLAAGGKQTETQQTVYIKNCPWLKTNSPSYLFRLSSLSNPPILTYPWARPCYISQR